MGLLSLGTGTAEGNSRIGVGKGEEKDGSSSCPGVWGQESRGRDNCQGLSMNYEVVTARVGVRGWHREKEVQHCQLILTRLRNEITGPILKPS